MEDSEKEINTGNRVFRVRKHCIFGKREEEGPFCKFSGCTGEGTAELLVE
jgi:hypothetical protein